MVELRDKNAQKKAREAMKRELRGDNPTCALCGLIIDMSLPHTSKWSFEVDHIIPLAKGGSNSYDNFQPVHQKCNRLKGDRFVEEIMYDEFDKSGCEC